MKQFLLICILSLCACFSASSQWVRLYTLNHFPDEVLLDSTYYTNDGLQHQYWTQYVTSDNGMSYNPGYQETYAYDSEDRLIEQILLYYNGSEWTNSSRNLFTYDTQGRLIEDLMQTYIGTWMNNYRMTMTYDENGFVDTETTDYWLSEAWTPGYETTYTNDEIGHVSSSSSSYYEGVWYPEGTKEYTYDMEDNLVLVAGFDYEGDSSSKEVFTYDEDGLNTFTRYSIWASSYMTWLYNEKFFTYDQYGNLIHEDWAHLDYTGGGTTYYDDGTLDHFYEYVEVAVTEMIDDKLITYPNPTHDQLTIEIQSYLSIIRIYDEKGRLTMETRGQKGINNLQVSSLVPGKYFITITSDNSISKTQWIKL